MANIVTDASSLNPAASHTPRVQEDLLRATLILRSSGQHILGLLDELELVSLVFLALHQDELARRGFTLCQYAGTEKHQDCIEQLLDTVHATRGDYDVIVEALYVIGRYDLLQDHLGMPGDAGMHKLDERGSIEDMRKAMYCVFAGMAQEEADRLLQVRLPDWYCPSMDRLLEETFIRKLSPTNYQSLVHDIYNALQEENKDSLASYLRPFMRQVRDIGVGRAPAEDTHYPPPSALPHGLCVIINVKTFVKTRTPDTVPLHERHGSDIDKERLTGTFKLFGFHVLHFDNPDSDRLEKFFKNLRTNYRLAGISCLAVCVMTHGDEQDHIYLHDRTCLSVTDLRQLCFSRALVGKPKLFFVQACRGDEVLRPIFLQQDNVVVTHKESDCLISTATVKGYSALRNQTSGSWYITDLCQALQEFGHVMPVKNVVQKTRRALMARVEPMNNTYVTQLSEDIDTLLGEVQFVRAEINYFTEGILDLLQLEVVEWVLEELVDSVMLERVGGGVNVGVSVGGALEKCHAGESM